MEHSKAFFTIFFLSVVIDAGEVFFIYLKNHTLSIVDLLLQFGLLIIIYIELRALDDKLFKSVNFSYYAKILLTVLFIFGWVITGILLAYTSLNKVNSSKDPLQILNFFVIGSNVGIILPSILFGLINREIITKTVIGQSSFHLQATDPILRQYNLFILLHLVLSLPFVFLLIFSLGFAYTGKLCTPDCVTYPHVLRLIIALVPFLVGVYSIISFRKLRKKYIARMKELLGSHYRSYMSNSW